MTGKKITHLICYDDHRTFTEDIRKKFSDPVKYRVESFHSPQEFTGSLKKLAENKPCKVVAIIGIPDNSGQADPVGKMTDEISRTYPDTGIILLVPSDRMEEIKKNLKFNIDAYITKNSNAILRIHNEVKKMVSIHNINIYRKRKNISLWALIVFILLCSLVVLIAYFRYPVYF